MKRNYLELSTKCNNLTSMREDFTRKQHLYGNKFKKNESQMGVTSTLRLTGLSGFSPVNSFSKSNKFN
jgi:hypothetical protein